VLNVSAGSPGPAWQGIAPGKASHLPKPFALSTLVRAVRGLLDTGR